MLALSLGIMAVPAKRGQWKTVKLADGTQVRVELRGDEFCHFWQAEDGRKFVRNTATGRYEIADMTSMVKLAEAKRAAANVQSAGRQNAPARTPAANAPSAYTGEKKGLVILVEFQDMRFTAGSRALYERIINEKNYSDSGLGFVGSVRDYFSDQSRGAFDLTFDIAGPVTMPENYAYYGGDTPYQDANVATMLRYALNAVDDEVDYTKYDWNGDGQVEQVFFIYAGLGQANGGDDNTIWPHKSAVANEAGTDYIRLDGMRILDYACSCELQPGYGGSDTHIDGIGTICHEYSHCLGLADIYDIDYSGGYGMGSWDLMSSGSYNSYGFRPACYTGFERMQIGWEQPTELNEDTSIEGLRNIEQGGGFYVVRNDGNPGGNPVYSGEYYILENRQKSGRWDAGLPASGLLITHVDYDQAAWNANGPNNDPNHQRCTPIPADGSTRNSEEGDTYPYGGNNSLTNSSTPAATVYTKNTDGSNYMNKSVTDITQNTDGTVSFNFSVASGPIFYESFDKCIGKGGNDNSWASIGSSKLGNGSFNADNDGWTGNGGGASKCAMFTGPATTPAIQLNGPAELTFKAGAVMPASNPNIYIEIAGAATSSAQAALSVGRFTEYRLNLDANGLVTLTFSSDAESFFLDEVKITSTFSTGISNAVQITDTGITESADDRIYSIDGRYVGKDVNSLGKGLYIRNGKKFVKK